MKTLIMTLAGMLLYAPAFAQVAGDQTSIVYGQSYNVVVSDPAELAAAMREFRASPTGQQLQSTVTLSQNVANGYRGATHTINVFYPSAGAMAGTMELYAGSQDYAEFIDRIDRVATVESDAVFTMRRSLINQESIQNPVTMLFGINVTDQPAFMKALDALFESEAAASFPGNVFFGQILAMGDTPGTHWVSFQAARVDTLMTGLDTFMQSADFAAYARNANDFREVTSRTIGREVLSLMPPQAQP